MMPTRTEPQLWDRGGARICMPDAVETWMAKAKSGDTLVYAEACWLPKRAVAPALVVLDAYFDDGDILFTQERRKDGQGYRYIAQKRARVLRPARRFVARERADSCGPRIPGAAGRSTQ
jgi:hypothetical protein